MRTEFDTWLNQLQEKITTLFMMKKAIRGVSLLFWRFGDLANSLSVNDTIVFNETVSYITIKIHHNENAR